MEGEVKKVFMFAEDMLQARKEIFELGGRILTTHSGEIPILFEAEIPISVVPSLTTQLKHPKIVEPNDFERFVNQVGFNTAVLTRLTRFAYEFHDQQPWVQRSIFTHQNFLAGECDYELVSIHQVHEQLIGLVRYQPTEKITWLEEENARELASQLILPNMPLSLWIAYDFKQESSLRHELAQAICFYDFYTKPLRLSIDAIELQQPQLAPSMSHELQMVG